MILPDFLTLPLIATGLVFSWQSGQLENAVIGVMVGYALFFLVEKFYKSVRGIDGLGRGDAKLFAAGGAWCGWYSLPFILLIASLSGLVYALFFRGKSNNNTHLPFGPHLACATLLVWVSHYLIQPY